LLRGRPSSSTCSLWDDPGGAVAKEELLALGLSPDFCTGTSVASATATTC
jgi:hypothetical protein